MARMVPLTALGAGRNVLFLLGMIICTLLIIGDIRVVYVIDNVLLSCMYRLSCSRLILLDNDN